MRASHGYDAITLATDTALPADTVVVSAFTPPSIDIGAVSKARVLLVHATDMDELGACIERWSRANRSYRLIDYKCA
jgi:hypothetical protein